MSSIIFHIVLYIQKKKLNSWWAKISISIWKWRMYAAINYYWSTTIMKMITCNVNLYHPSTVYKLFLKVSPQKAYAKFRMLSMLIRAREAQFSILLWFCILSSCCRLQCQLQLICISKFPFISNSSRVSHH